MLGLPTSSMNPSRGVRLADRGISAIEVIAVLSVIALLAALSLPAIQQSRESARLIQCRNNLKQLALATSVSESQNQALPLAHTPVSQSSAFVGLLPFLDQMPLRQKLNSQESILRQQPFFENRPALLGCPADPAVWNQRTRTSYAGNWGSFDPAGFNLPPEDALNFVYNTPTTGVIVGTSPKHRIQFADVTDGLSQTVLFGELLSGGYEEPRRAIWNDASSLEVLRPEVLGARCEAATAIMGYSNRTALWMFGHPGQTLYDHTLAPNRKFCTYVLTSSSAHVGGAHFAKCDGSVQFFASSIDPSLWRAMGTRDGGEHTP